MPNQKIKKIIDDATREEFEKKMHQIIDNLKPEHLQGVVEMFAAIDFKG